MKLNSISKLSIFVFTSLIIFGISESKADSDVLRLRNSTHSNFNDSIYLNLGDIQVDTIYSTLEIQLYTTNNSNLTFILNETESELSIDPNSGVNTSLNGSFNITINITPSIFYDTLQTFIINGTSSDPVRQNFTIFIVFMSTTPNLTYSIQNVDFGDIQAGTNSSQMYLNLTNENSSNDISIINLTVNYNFSLKNFTLISSNYTNEYYTYQETANSIDSSGDWSLSALFSNTFDGDWGTQGSANTGTAYGYYNYTKPNSATNNSLWQIKDDKSTRNISLPDTVWNQNVLQFRVRSVYTAFDVYWDAWNGTEWIELSNDLTSGKHWVYEEAMYWKIEDIVYLNSYSVNTTIQSNSYLLLNFTATPQRYSDQSFNQSINITLNTTYGNINQDSAYLSYNSSTPTLNVNLTYDFGNRLANAEHTINLSLTNSGTINKIHFNRNNVSINNSLYYISSIDYLNDTQELLAPITNMSLLHDNDGWGTGVGVGAIYDGQNHNLWSNLYTNNGSGYIEDNLTLSGYEVHNVSIRWYGQAIYGDCSHGVAIRVNGTDYYSPKYTNDATAWYTYTWYNNPNNSKTWTSNDINNLLVAASFFGSLGGSPVIYSMYITIGASSIYILPQDTLILQLKFKPDQYYNTNVTGLVTYNCSNAYGNININTTIVTGFSSTPKLNVNLSYNFGDVRVDSEHSATITFEQLNGPNNIIINNWTTNNSLFYSINNTSIFVNSGSSNTTTLYFYPDVYYDSNTIGQIVWNCSALYGLIDTNITVVTGQSITPTIGVNESYDFGNNLIDIDSSHYINITNLANSNYLTIQENEIISNHSDFNTSFTIPSYDEYNVTLTGVVSGYVSYGKGWRHDIGNYSYSVEDFNYTYPISHIEINWRYIVYTNAVMKKLIKTHDTYYFYNIDGYDSIYNDVEVFNTNPFTNTTWTIDEILNLEVGMSHISYSDYSDYSCNLYPETWVRIYYNQSATRDVTIQPTKSYNKEIIFTPSRYYDSNQICNISINASSNYGNITPNSTILLGKSPTPHLEVINIYDFGDSQIDINHSYNISLTAIGNGVRFDFLNAPLDNYFTINNSHYSVNISNYNFAEYNSSLYYHLTNNDSRLADNSDSTYYALGDIGGDPYSDSFALSNSDFHTKDDTANISNITLYFKILVTAPPVSGSFVNISLIVNGAQYNHTSQGSTGTYTVGFSTNPSTGSKWSLEDINNLEINIDVQRTFGYLIRIYECYIDVYLDEPSTGSFYLPVNESINLNFTFYTSEFIDVSEIGYVEYNGSSDFGLVDTNSTVLYAKSTTPYIITSGGHGDVQVGVEHTTDIEFYLNSTSPNTASVAILSSNSITNTTTYTILEDRTPVNQVAIAGPGNYEYSSRYNNINLSNQRAFIKVWLSDISSVISFTVRADDGANGVNRPGTLLEETFKWYSTDEYVRIYNDMYATIAHTENNYSNGTYWFGFKFYDGMYLGERSPNSANVYTWLGYFDTEVFFSSRHNQNRMLASQVGILENEAIVTPTQNSTISVKYTPELYSNDDSINLTVYQLGTNLYNHYSYTISIASKSSTPILSYSNGSAHGAVPAGGTDYLNITIHLENFSCPNNITLLNYTTNNSLFGIDFSQAVINASQNITYQWYFQPDTFYPTLQTGSHTFIVDETYGPIDNESFNPYHTGYSPLPELGCNLTIYVGDVQAGINNSAVITFSELSGVNGLYVTNWTSNNSQFFLNESMSIFVSANSTNTTTFYFNPDIYYDDLTYAELSWGIFGNETVIANTTIASGKSTTPTFLVNTQDYISTGNLTYTYNFDEVSDYDYDSYYINISNSEAKLNVIFNNSHSIEFDGTNDYINVTTTGDLDFEGENHFSISAWIYLDSLGHSGPVVGRWWGTPNQQWLLRFKDVGNEMRFEVRNSDNTNSQVDSITTLSLNNWTHVVATANGTHLSMYINGLFDNIETYKTTLDDLDSSYNPRLGMSHTTTEYEGRIDEISIWNISINDTHVSEIYNNGIPSNLLDHSLSSDILAWWRMGDNDTYPNISDNIGNNDGVMLNMDIGDIVSSANITFTYNNSIIHFEYNITCIRDLQLYTFFENATKPDGTEIKYNLHNGSHHLYYTDNWTVAIGHQGNTSSELNSIISSYPYDHVQFYAILFTNTNKNSTPILHDVNVTYEQLCVPYSNFGSILIGVQTDPIYLNLTNTDSPNNIVLITGVDSGINFIALNTSYNYTIPANSELQLYFAAFPQEYQETLHYENITWTLDNIYGNITIGPQNIVQLGYTSPRPTLVMNISSYNLGNTQVTSTNSGSIQFEAIGNNALLNWTVNQTDFYSSNILISVSNGSTNSTQFYFNPSQYYDITQICEMNWTSYNAILNTTILYGLSSTPQLGVNLSYDFGNSIIDTEHSVTITFSDLSIGPNNMTLDNWTTNNSLFYTNESISIFISANGTNTTTLYFYPDVYYDSNQTGQIIWNCSLDLYGAINPNSTIVTGLSSTPTFDVNISSIDHGNISVPFMNYEFINIYPTTYSPNSVYVLNYSCNNSDFFNGIVNYGTPTNDNNNIDYYTESLTGTGWLYRDSGTSTVSLSNDSVFGNHSILMSDVEYHPDADYTALLVSDPSKRPDLTNTKYLVVSIKFLSNAENGIVFTIDGNIGYRNFYNQNYNSIVYENNHWYTFIFEIHPEHYEIFFGSNVPSNLYELRFRSGDSKEPATYLVDGLFFLSNYSNFVIDSTQNTTLINIYSPRNYGDDSCILQFSVNETYGAIDNESVNITSVGSSPLPSNNLILYSYNNSTENLPQDNITIQFNITNNTNINYIRLLEYIWTLDTSTDLITNFSQLLLPINFNASTFCDLYIHRDDVSYDTHSLPVNAKFYGLTTLLDTKDVNVFNLTFWPNYTMVDFEYLFPIFTQFTDRYLNTLYTTSDTADPWRIFNSGTYDFEIRTRTDNYLSSNFTNVEWDYMDNESTYHEINAYQFYKIEFDNPNGVSQCELWLNLSASTTCSLELIINSVSHIISITDTSWHTEYLYTDDLELGTNEIILKLSGSSAAKIYLKNASSNENITFYNWDPFNHYVEQSESSISIAISFCDFILKRETPKYYPFNDALELDAGDNNQWDMAYYPTVYTDESYVYIEFIMYDNDSRYLDNFTVVFEFNTPRRVLIISNMDDLDIIVYVGESNEFNVQFENIGTTSCTILNISSTLSWLQPVGYESIILDLNIPKNVTFTTNDLLTDYHANENFYSEIVMTTTNNGSYDNLLYAYVRLRSILTIVQPTDGIRYIEREAGETITTSFTIRNDGLGTGYFTVYTSTPNNTLNSNTLSYRGTDFSLLYTDDKTLEFQIIGDVVINNETFYVQIYESGEVVATFTIICDTSESTQPGSWTWMFLIWIIALIVLIAAVIARRKLNRKNQLNQVKLDRNDEYNFNKELEGSTSRKSTSRLRLKITLRNILIGAIFMSVFILIAIPIYLWYTEAYEPAWKIVDVIRNRV